MTHMATSAPTLQRVINEGPGDECGHAALEDSTLDPTWVEVALEARPVARDPGKGGSIPDIGFKGQVPGAFG